MNKKFNVHLMCIIVFLQGLVFYGPISTLYRQSRGLSMFNLFFIESLYMIFMIIFEIPWGYFADKYGYKLTLIISNLLLFISKIVFYKADSFYLFFIERFLMAVAFSGISGCDIALLYSSIDKEESEKVFGIYNASNSIGFIAACIISMPMINKSMDFAVMSSIFPYAAALILSFFIRDVDISHERKADFKVSLKDAISNKRVFIIVISAAIMGEISHSIGDFLNQLQYLKSGINIIWFGVLSAAMQVICLLSVKTHIFTKKFGQNLVTKVLLLNIFVSCIFLVYANKPWTSITLIAVIQGSFAVMQPIILDIKNKAVFSSNRATVLSIYAMAGDITAALVNLPIGKFANISVESAFTTCAVISFGACALGWIYFKYKKVILN